jgi:hypothetical protein
MEPWNLLIVPLFVLAAAACGIAAVMSCRHGRGRGSRDPRMWAMFAVIFLVFVVMKTQRVVEMLGSAARSEARAEGVYDQRHPYQFAVVAVATALCLLQAAYFSSYIAQRWRRYRWPLLGAGTIICFGVVRAASLHELDALGPWMQGGKAVVESLAAVLTVWGAVTRIRHLRAPAHAPHHECAKGVHL